MKASPKARLLGQFLQMGVSEFTMTPASQTVWLCTAA